MSPVDGPRTVPRRPLIALVVLVLVASFAGLRSQPPGPVGADAPATTFSATRARAVLERIADGSTPHAVGTPTAASLRDRIEQELRAVGATVERQRTWSCRGISCAPVVNIIGELPGAHPDEPVVLLTSHYDSVHAGPGIGDDLHAVAIAVEVLANLGADATRPRHTVRVLMTEGEEEGLLGAAAYVDQHPAAHEVGVVVNVEARGTSGLSSMFETSDGNAALVAAYLRDAPRPQATSLAYEIYRRMPNDTDLTVFREAGYAGLNFAFVGNVGHYHTPLDDLEHLDMGSLQHQGDNALAAVRSLARGPLPLPTTEDSIYADVLGLLVVSWPASWAMVVPISILLAIAGLWLWARRRGQVTVGKTVLGLLAVLALLLLAMATGFVVAWTVGAIQGELLPAHAQPLPLRLALWSASVLMALLLAAGLGRWARPLELAFGIWTTWGLGALALAAWVPGASVALCIPVGAATLGLAWAVAQPRHCHRALLVAAVVHVALWTALGLALEDAFGFALAPAVVAPIAIAISGLMPGLCPEPGKWRPAMKIVGALLVITTAIASLVAVYDDNSPRRIALMHYDDRVSGEAIVTGMTRDAPPPALREAAGWSGAPVAALPWSRRRVLASAGTITTAPPPQLQVTANVATPGGRTVHATLTSPRGADRAIVKVEAARVSQVLVQGQPTATGVDAGGRLRLFGIPASGAQIQLEVSQEAPTSVLVVDCVDGLPESAAEIAAVRDQDGVTVQWGDVGCVGTQVSL
ncbi:MAG: M28 family peptidase [Deltaproteobacteria bacterium]|nr:M28 family peptidase [Deltaproteobacteria bacterium]